METFYLHHDRYPTPSMMLHSPSTDEAVLLFVTTYTEYFEFLEIWQRMQVLYILDHALQNPYTMRRSPTGKACLKPLYEFTRACIAIWKSHGTARPSPPSQDLLDSIPKADHIVIPGAAQFESMVDDLFVLGRRRMGVF